MTSVAGLSWEDGPQLLSDLQAQVDQVWSAKKAARRRERQSVEAQHNRKEDANGTVEETSRASEPTH